MATFEGSTQVDNFVGTDSSGDIFLFDPANLNYYDRIIGNGSRPQDPLDQLVITSGGGVNLIQYFDNDRIRVSGIEILTLSDSGNNVALSLEFIDQTSTGHFDIYGGQGNDTIYAYPVDWNYEERLTEVFFYGGDGDDSEGITFFARDKAYGGAGNDVLGGNAGFLDGGTGNDILFSGNKTLAYGGAGSDILQGASGSTLDGGAGIDYVVAVDDFVLPHDVTLVGIEGVAINDIRCTIDALSPISRLKGIRSFDEAKIELVGGGKIDFGDFVESPKKLVLTLSDGADFDITAADHPTHIYGGSGTYQLRGGSADDRLYGGIGSDRLAGNDGNDQLFGSNGDDVIVGGKGRDHLGGGWGSDTIYGGAGNDVLDLDVQDIHDVPPFQDVCYGGGGNDTFKIMGYLSAGDGVIDGGSGVDTIDARDLGDVSRFTVTNVEVIIGDKMYRSVALTAQTLSSVTLLDLGVAPTDWVTSMTVQAVGGGVFDVQGKLKDTSIGVRLVGGDTYDFTLLATEKNDLLQAGSGHDVMYGRGGDDIFYTSQLVNVNNPDEAYGNGGDDAFHSFENGEHLFGGNGNDTFYNPGCIADGGSGYDVVNVSSVLKDGSYTNMEALIATGAVLSATAAALGQFSVIQCLELDNFQADLYVTGSERFDLSGSLQGYRFSAPWTLSGLNFKASNFADHMTLSQFADDVDAAGGNDYVLGGDGDDTVSGGAGDDRLVGGTGSDNLAGGTGNDTFYYEQLYAQPDVITDFVTGEDTLALDFALAWGSNPNGFGPLRSKFFQSSTFDVAKSSDIRFIYDTDDGRLYFDLDGNKLAFDPVLVATLTNMPALAASDIYVL